MKRSTALSIVFLVLIIVLCLQPFRTVQGQANKAVGPAGVNVYDVRVYGARGDGTMLHSQLFAIHNMSGATAQELQDFAATLEQAYADVAKFLEKAPPSSI